MVPDSVAERAQAQREVKLISAARQGLQVFARNASHIAQRHVPVVPSLVSQVRRGLHTFARNWLSAIQSLQTTDREHVLLNPAIFSMARHYLAYKPSADMFGRPPIINCPDTTPRMGRTWPPRAWMRFNTTGNRNFPLFRPTLDSDTRGVAEVAGRQGAWHDGGP